MRNTAKRLNILFTSVGRRVELLKAFRRSYQRLGLDGNLIATDIDPLAPGLQVADRRYSVPPNTSSQFAQMLLEICREESVDIVFPLIDPDILILADHATAFEQAGARPSVVSHSAAIIAADKWATSRFFADLGLAVPESWLADDLRGRRMEFPLFIKPRRGSAGKHTHRVDSVSELEFFTEHVPEPIVQRYLSGPEVTVDIACDLDGNLLGIVPRQRIEVRSGEVAKSVTIHRPDIVEACRRVASALPAIGPITVQCIVDRGIPHFIEINARMGGGLPLGIAAGVDVPLWLLAHAASIPLEIPPIGTYRTDLYMTRFDDSYMIDGAELDS